MTNNRLLANLAYRFVVSTRSIGSFANGIVEVKRFAHFAGGDARRDLRVARFRFVPNPLHAKLALLKRAIDSQRR